MDSDGLVCVSCGEWFEVVTNTHGPGLNYCPCCGHEFSENDFIKMNADAEEDDDEDEEDIEDDIIDDEEEDDYEEYDDDEE